MSWGGDLETERDELGNVWVTVQNGTDVDHINYGKDPEGDDE